MENQRTRVRYFAAMGLVSPVALGLFACRTATPSRATANTERAIDAAPATTAGSDVVGPPATGMTPPTPTAPKMERHDAGAGRWTLVARPTEAQQAALPRATCPSGIVCVDGAYRRALPSPRRPGRTLAADAGFGECPALIGAGIVERFDPQITARERALVADACCYTWFEPCPGGRPLRDGTVAVFADDELRDDWTRATASILDHDDATRRALERYWLAEAAAEHASIASFSRFSLQLLALGAPSTLVTGANEAALDEIRHAEQCYALAARASGVLRGPSALTLPGGTIATDPATVAAETLRDGCIGESLAARGAAIAAEATTDGYAREVLLGIAKDEERHAELAWRTMAWLLARHGAPIREIVDAFVVDVQNHAESSARACINDASYAEHGVLDARRRSEAQRETLVEIVLPCLNALLTTDPSPDPGSSRDESEAPTEATASCA